MHIVIDARIINSSTGRYIERLLHYLQIQDKTNKYTVLLYKKDQNFWKPTNKNFSTIVADYDQFSFAEQLSYYFFLKKLKPDLVHFTVPHRPVLFTDKNITTFHDLSLLKTYNEDKNWLLYHSKQFVGKWAFKIIAKTSTYIITPTKYTKDDLLDYVSYPSNKIIVTYEGSDVQASAPKPVTVPYEKYIMYLGKQSSYKNIRRLGAAHQKLLKKYPNLGLVLVGKKDKAVLSNEAYFKEKGYKNIHFTGFLSDQEAAWLYKNTEAYIFPSLLEGFGLPGLEAMGCGAPVISSNATCLPEVYGDAALYFDPLDTDDMASKISSILDDKKLRNNLITKGYKQVQKYSWEKMAHETLAVYNQALKER